MKQCYLQTCCRVEAAAEPGPSPNLGAGPGLGPKPGPWARPARVWMSKAAWVSKGTDGKSINVHKELFQIRHMRWLKALTFMHMSFHVGERSRIVFL